MLFVRFLIRLLGYHNLFLIIGPNMINIYSRQFLLQEKSFKTIFFYTLSLHELPRILSCAKLLKDKKKTRKFETFFSCLLKLKKPYKFLIKCGRNDYRMPYCKTTSIWHIWWRWRYFLGSWNFYQTIFWLYRGKYKYHPSRSADKQPLQQKPNMPN